MKELLLNKKWVGVLVTLICTLLITVSFTKTVKDIVRIYAPVVESEAQGFLPITFSGGQITYPKDVVMSKTYGSGAEIFKVVIDTRNDELSSADLHDMGVYFSKKFMYTVNRNKTEIHSLANFPDTELNKDTVHYIINYAQTKVGSITFFVTLIFMLCFVGVAVMIYALLSQAIMALVFHTPFKMTLRISTLTYLALLMLSYFAHLSTGFIVSFLIIAAVNAAVNYILKQEKAA
ncbi:MAG: DUF1189 family protein [Alphaproteobacteria bacterium]|nr:DUF1189 family protein [Alphaproteobacteria bacterium]